MCTRYISPAAEALERYFRFDKGRRGLFNEHAMHPRSKGSFIRKAGEGNEPEWELVAGQWGLIPSFAKESNIRYSTFNARFEEITEKASYRQPWARGQRCIIPALSFDEPCWETGRNVWWRFARADDEPWWLAGLWNTWIDRATGEVHESYTMLTINADAHPLMRRMHKPDPKFGPDEQDKRSVVAIDRADVDRWLTGSVDEARGLVKLTPTDLFVAGPVDSTNSKSA